MYSDRVHDSSRAIVRLWGLLVRVNLPPLSALFSTDVAAGFCSIIELELISVQSALTKGNAHLYI